MRAWRGREETDCEEDKRVKTKKGKKKIVFCQPAHRRRLQDERKILFCCSRIAFLHTTDPNRLHTLQQESFVKWGKRRGGGVGASLEVQCPMFNLMGLHVEYGNRKRLLNYSQDSQGFSHILCWKEDGG